MLYKSVSVILVTLTATFSVWMICGFYFHRFSLMFLPLNLIAVPLLPLFLILFFVYMIFWNIGINSDLLKYLLDSMYSRFNKTAEIITSHTPAFDHFYPDRISVIIWILSLCILAYILQNKKTRKLFWIPVLGFSFSLISLPLLSGKELPNGFIIQKNSQSPSIISYIEGKENLILLPEDEVSFTQINGKKILSLSTPNYGEKTFALIPEADIIMFSGQCYDLSPEILQTKKDECIIVTHPSLHWKREKKLLSQAKELGLKVHSLRYDGPLHMFS